VLLRRPTEQGDDLARGPDFIVGDLCDEETYKSRLEGVDTVIHLAALTGKAAPPEYERTNFEGTKILLRACKEAGVRRFLHLSTIAAGYPDQRYFTYAQTKARAETLVRESGIPYIIIRPTVVIGSGSPIWRSLSSIAKLPVVPLPNEGRVSRSMWTT
jgi:nucleoside-diphosphate-sugar epimerase